MIAVVKADGYGHGAVPVARALTEAGCRHFAVLSVSEAVALREAGLDEPILLLGGVHAAEEASEVAARDITAVVHARADLQLLAHAASRRRVPLPVQVEVDTGMSRMGVAASDALYVVFIGGNGWPH